MIFPICLYGKMRGALLNTFVDLIRLSYLNQAEPPCSQHHGCAYLGPADTGAARCARRQRPAVGKSALQGGPQRWRRHRDDQSRHSVRTLARRPGTQFDALKLNWIGSPNWDTTVCAARKDVPVQTRDRCRRGHCNLPGASLGDRRDEIQSSARLSGIARELRAVESIT